MLCAPGLVFDGTEGFGSHFHVLHARTHFRRYRGHLVPFHVLRSHTRFRRCRVRRVPFSCFMFPVSFSAVSSASGPVFLFCSPGLVFSPVECVWSRFHALRARTHFQRYRERRVPFSCFALPDSFSMVPRASGVVFMFSAPGLIFGGTEGVKSCFHILPARTRFRRYRGRRVPYSRFARPKFFSAVPRASGPVFLFCAP
jgi:hypothetical protein